MADTKRTVSVVDTGLKSTVVKFTTGLDRSLEVAFRKAFPKASQNVWTGEYTVPGVRSAERVERWTAKQAAAAAQPSAASASVRKKEAGLSERKPRNFAAMREDRVLAMARAALGRDFASKADAVRALAELPVERQHALAKPSSGVKALFEKPRSTASAYQRNADAVRSAGKPPEPWKLVEAARNNPKLVRRYARAATSIETKSAVQALTMLSKYGFDKETKRAAGHALGRLDVAPKPKPTKAAPKGATMASSNDIAAQPAKAAKAPSAKAQAAETYKAVSGAAPNPRWSAKEIARQTELSRLEAARSAGMGRMVDRMMSSNPAGWSDAAREGSANARGVAMPGEAQSAAAPKPKAAKPAAKVKAPKSAKVGLGGLAPTPQKRSRSKLVMPARDPDLAGPPMSRPDRLVMPARDPDLAGPPMSRPDRLEFTPPGISPKTPQAPAAGPAGWSDAARQASAETRAADAKPVKPAKANKATAVDVAKIDRLSARVEQALKPGADPASQARMISDVKAEIASAKLSKAESHALARRAAGRAIAPSASGKAALGAVTGRLEALSTHLSKVIGSAGRSASALGPPLAIATAAAIAYDSTKSQAQAAGKSGASATGDALKAAAVAGGTTAAVSAGVGLGAKALVSVGGKAVARAIPVVAVGIAGYEAYQGYQKDGIKGAGEALADFATFGAYSYAKGKMTGGAAPTAYLNAAAQANAERSAPRAPVMTRMQAGGGWQNGRGFANKQVQQAAQAARRRSGK